MGFYAFKATQSGGKTTGYGGGNLPLTNVLTLRPNTCLDDPCVTPTNPVKLGEVGIHVCLFPAQCRVFLPHAAMIWRVWVPDDAQCDAIDCWQVAVSRVLVDREVTEEEVGELSHGTLDGPNGTSLSMNKGQLHSFDGEPSEVTAAGTRKWHWFGKLHREGDQPAMVFANGLGFWIKEGKFKREGQGEVVASMVEM